MKNNRTLYIILITIVAVFIGFVVFLTGKKPIDTSSINISSILEASEESGNIADHVKGDPNSKIILFEYGDYQCSGCATVNPWIKTLLEEYSGKLAIVFRSFPLMTLHPNAIAASSAVEAAGLQGYWEEYGDYLYANQAEWYYATGTERTEYFVTYFKNVAGDSADIAKFKSDMSSSDVKKKIDFDTAIGNKLDIDATPSLFDSEGKEIDWFEANTKDKFLKFFRNYLDEKLAEAE